MISTTSVAFLILMSAAGQRGATVSGTVQDQQGGVIGQARVEIDCGGHVTRTTTGSDGRFAASGLLPGSCTVAADAALFARASVTVQATAAGADVTVVLSTERLMYDVQVTATRGVEEARGKLPQATSVTTRQEIDERAYQLLPQTLREAPGVLVQQTTSAQGSPTIRGFTGSANAYLVDGVRFNLSSWRGGPSQYLAWVEPSSVDRLEVVRGPGSVQYGSDALGGTINVLTAKPDFVGSGSRISGDVTAAFGSAETSSVGEANVVVQGKNAALRGGGSARSVNDLRGGDGLDSHAAVTRYFEVPSDTLIGNRMPHTAYDQSGGYLTGQVRTSANGILSGTYVHGRQTGASRYDRIDGGNGLYRSGFDPQRLDFGVLRYSQRESLGFENISGTVSLNRQADGTYEQTRPTTVLDRQQAVNRAIGFQLDARRRMGSRQQVSVGVERYGELISDAFREQVNPASGVSVPQRPDIPNGTRYTSLGVFAQDVVEVVPNRVSVRAGLRYGRFAFSTKADPALGVVDESVKTDALTFQAGTVVKVARHIDATFSASRGFRAPNASDLGSIGLSGGGGFGITPSRAAALGGIVGTTAGTDAVSTGFAVPALGPEDLYAYELGARFTSDRVSGGVMAYDLEYLDTVQRRAIVFPTNVVGSVIAGYEIVRQDASGLAYIAQDIRPIATSVNLDRSRIQGLELDGSVRLATNWSAVGYFAMSNGRLLSTGEPLRRMSPPIGGARLRWGSSRRWVEGTMTFARTQTRLNSGDLTDARIGAARTRSSIASYFNGTASDLGYVKNGVLVATGETLAQIQNRVMGTASTTYLYTTGPGFIAFGARGGFLLSQRLAVTVIGENLTDRNYRVYGSGVDMPGASVTVRTTLRF